MELNEIVPWGRSLEEYKDMFMLSNKDLESKILVCGDGPASFNAELSKLNGKVVSIDPTYKFSVSEFKSRIKEVTPIVIAEVERTKEQFVWKNIKSVDELKEIRIKAMDMFLKDFEQGKKEGRYIEASLPKLPFKSESFDLALSSHFLFLYSEHLDYKFHISSILEMLKVAKELIVFPITTLKGERSLHIEKIIANLKGLGYNCSIVKTDYEFVKGSNEMLKIIKG